MGIEALAEIALYLRWSWNRSTDVLWAALDPETLGRDPQPMGCAPDGLSTQSSGPPGAP